MNRLEARVIKLEAAGQPGQRSWRALIGRPIEEWPDEALLGFLGEPEGWPLGHEPANEELDAVAFGWGERD